MYRSNNRILLVSILAFILLFSFNGMSSAQDTTAEVGVFEPFQVSPGLTVQVPVSIRGVEGLYGVDFTLEFDPDLLQVLDADPAMEGVQAGLGDFLDPGLLLFNTVDNKAGTLRFTMAQYNPSEAKSGSGNLLVITFEGVAVGESALEISSVSLSSREGVEILSKGISGSLLVSQEAPTQSATFIVVQSTSLILINTETPVPTQTPLPTATPKPAPTQQIGSAMDNTTPGGIDEGSQPAKGTSVPFLVSNWWLLLVLLLVVLVVGLFGYRKISRDNKGSKK